MSKSANPSSSYATGSRLSLAAKLYSIFALIAFLTAAIAVLSHYNTRRNAELTAAIETANLAALNVERVNSLVYAVVMESRGVYMSSEPAVVKKYGDGLLKFNEQILAVVKNWESIVQTDDAEQFAVFKKRIEQFVDFRKELVRRGESVGPRQDASIDDWVAHVALGRRTVDQLGWSVEDDVADPIGRPAKVYAATAAELDNLVSRLVRLMWGPVTAERKA